MPSVDLLEGFEIYVNIDVDSAIDFLDRFADDVEEPVDDAIFNWLWDLKNLALATKPWKDRTGALRAAHRVTATHDGWALKVDARETSGKDYNYAYALEMGWLSGKYQWLQPAVDSMEDELVLYVEKEIENYLERAERYSRSMFEKRTGEQYVMLRHPKGAKDPFTGESIGGRYFRKL